MNRGRLGDHVCTRACLRVREMFGRRFFWCARYSWNGRNIIENKNWRSVDRKYRVGAEVAC